MRLLLCSQQQPKHASVMSSFCETVQDFSEITDFSFLYHIPLEEMNLSSYWELYRYTDL